MNIYKSRAAIETFFYVIEQPEYSEHWEISVAETTVGSAGRIVRWGKAINVKTGNTLVWKKFDIATSNQDVRESLEEIIQKNYESSL